MIKECINITEEDIASYMQQFNVNRATAIRNIVESMKAYYDRQEEEMQDTYNSILRGRY